MRDERGRYTGLRPAVRLSEAERAEVAKQLDMLQEMGAVAGWREERGRWLVAVGQVVPVLHSLGPAECLAFLAGAAAVGEAVAIRMGESR